MLRGRFLPLIVSFGIAACAEQPSVDAPNLVLIVVDTLRADMVLDPEERVATPELDRLAADGVLFSSAFSHAPMTLPSHTTLFASQLPHETGVLVNFDEVPRRVPLLAELLEQRGFDTGAIISLGTLVSQHGRDSTLDRGFGHYEHAPGPIARADAVHEDLLPLLDDLDGDRPFFLFAHFSDPHEPYNAHGLEEKKAELFLDGESLGVLSMADTTSWEGHTVALAPGEHVFEFRSTDPIALRMFRCRRGGRELPLEFLESGLRHADPVIRIRVEHDGWWTSEHELDFWIGDHPGAMTRARYEKEVEYADAFVGRLLATLRERGLYDESLIVFTSDHGETLEEPRETGHVNHLYDEVLHVPLIIKPPAARSADAARLAEVRERLVGHVDLAPTILDLLGLAPAASHRGRSLLDEREEATIFAETHRPESVRNAFALRDERFKLVYYPDERRFELFDLVADPAELVDLFEERGKELLDWQIQLRDVWRRTFTTDDELDLDPEQLERMRALGYLGEAE